MRPPLAALARLGRLAGLLGLIGLAAPACAEERDIVLVVTFADECANVPATTLLGSIKVQVLFYRDGLQPLDDAECLEIDPPATREDMGNAFLTLITRGYVAREIPTGNTSYLLLVVHGGPAAVPPCGDGDEVLCGVSLPFSHDNLIEVDGGTLPILPIKMLCSGSEPPTGFGFNECLSISRSY